jgi:hypothetical protein
VRDRNANDSGNGKMKQSIGTYIAVARIVLVPTILLVFFVEQHDLCSVKVVHLKKETQKKHGNG